ncbi:MAG: HAD family hydrolase [Candidatus Diapherotrites archaeon]|nr:HAD family hydrolase [Candidatus Diapherotrites archaeon]
MVNALFFDLTDTLQEFDWSKQWKLLVPIVGKELKHDIDGEVFRQKYQQVYESYRLGWISSDFEFFDLLFKQLGLNASKRQILNIVKKHLEIRKDFTWLPKDYKKTLQALRKDFGLAVVSSGVAPWGYYDFKRIFGFDFKKDFDLVLFSSEQGFLKESGKLFELALKKFKLKPRDAAFVGNSYNDDVLLAKKFGLKTVFLNKKREPKGKSDFEISELCELLKISEALKKA